MAENMETGSKGQAALRHEDESPDRVSSSSTSRQKDKNILSRETDGSKGTTETSTGEVVPLSHPSPCSALPAPPDRRQTKRQQRHSKRLSLNFPILIPTHSVMDDTSPEYSASPAATLSRFSSFPTSSYTQIVSSSSSSTFPTPLTPPSESSEDNSPLPRAMISQAHSTRGHARSHTLAHTVRAPVSTPDFLTLLASQERRVLELREELHRAETELQVLKKQWATHEANRKKGEIKKGVVKMNNMAGSPVSPGYGRNHARDYGVPRTPRQGHARSATVAIPALAVPEINQDPSDVELEKRKSLAQERLLRRATLEHVTSPQGTRRSGQRVFSGSRHTRALSLLTTNSSTAGANQTPALGSSDTNSRSATNSAKSDSREDREDSHDVPLFMPSLIRSNSGLARELDFRKTYKDLASAASRRSLPAGADVLMKQGRIVVDGVRDGLWNFLEDIRQATVGEEAAREGEPERPDGFRSRRRSTQKRNGSTNSDAKDTEPSFWSEFGIDTPKVDKVKAAANPSSKLRSKQATSAEGHVDMVQAPSGCTGSTRRQDSSPREEEDEQLPHIDAPKDSSTSIAHTRFQNARKQKKEHEHHESKSSTDSRDSRDSHNPPSLLSDDLTEEQEGDDDNWEWGEVDSPHSARKVAFVDLKDSKVASSDKVSSRLHKQKDKEVLWHELTR